jgi:protein-disulfide isomerase
MKHPLFATTRAPMTLTLACLAIGLALVTPAAIGRSESGEKPAKAAKKAAIKGDSKKIPLAGSPMKGNPNAAVTIVEFSDFQCPFCSRVNPTLKTLLERYPDDVRVVFKHMPLDFHKNAKPAAKLAWAAQQQGKFWEMHDLLFEKQRELDDIETLGATLGGQLGLNVSQLMADMGSDAAEAALKADKELAEALNVRGTPNFLINGVRLTGAQPVEKFDEAVRAELEAVKKAVKGKQKPSELYSARVESNYQKPEAPKRDDAPEPEFVVGVVTVTEADPARGPKDAPVTIVAFSDFQCPFCSRAVGTVDELTRTHKKDVRIVFKHLPLSFHDKAEPAARLAWAAQQQGKFWEMHDLLFKSQERMQTASIEELAGELGSQLKLNVGRLKEDMESEKAKQKVAQDMAEAKIAGASGTPSFFVNGRAVVGAQPASAFEDIIKEELAQTKRLRAADKKLSGESLHQAAIKANKARYDEIVEAEQKAEQALAAERLKLLTIGASPVLGDPKAPVLIYEFTDLQCPFCARGAKTLDEVVKKYPGKVTIVSKQFPLPFHKNAEDAGVAALAAGRQGKYWEMRSLIFADQVSLSKPEVFLSLANTLGLDVKRFEKDMADPALRKQVKEEAELGAKLGVKGTPSFFINGEFVVGAQPAEAFEAVINTKL